MKKLFSVIKTPECAYLISSVYGYRCGTRGSSSGYYTGKLPLSSLKAELFALSSPLYAGFEPASGGSIGHAVVVSGYVDHGGSPTMTYVDPGDARIKATTIPSNGAVTITYSGSAHGLSAAFAVYE